MNSKPFRLLALVLIGVIAVFYTETHRDAILDFLIATGLDSLFVPLAWIEQARLLNPLWGIPVTLLISHMTIVTVTVYLHREQAHRALTLSPRSRLFFRFWLWLTTTMVTKEWAAVHRKHHAKCETEEDPHSPKQLGLANVVFDGVTPYRIEADNKETLEKYGIGTPDDWLERHLFTHKSKFLKPILSRRYLGVILLWALFLWLFGLAGVAYASLLMIWIPLFAAGGINGVGHAIGYRNFETNDESTNIVRWGILIGGEELHNNHHAYPTSPRFRQLPEEFDLGWWYIELLERFGLAEANKERLAPMATTPFDDIVQGRTWTDFRREQMRLLRKFMLEVLRPNLRTESATLGRKARRFSRVFRKHPGRLTERERSILENELESSPSLRDLHIAWRELVDAFEERRGTLGKLQAEKLHAWCERWKNSNSQAFRQFANFLLQRIPASE